MAARRRRAARRVGHMGSGAQPHPARQRHLHRLHPGRRSRASGWRSVRPAHQYVAALLPLYSDYSRPARAHLASRRVTCLAARQRRGDLGQLAPPAAARRRAARAADRVGNARPAADERTDFSGAPATHADQPVPAAAHRVGVLVFSAATRWLGRTGAGSRREHARSAGPFSSVSPLQTGVARGRVDRRVSRGAERHPPRRRIRARPRARALALVARCRGYGNRGPNTAIHESVAARGAEAPPDDGRGSTRSGALRDRIMADGGCRARVLRIVGGCGDRPGDCISATSSWFASRLRGGRSGHRAVPIADRLSARLEGALRDALRQLLDRVADGPSAVAHLVGIVRVLDAECGGIARRARESRARVAECDHGGRTARLRNDAIHDAQTASATTSSQFRSTLSTLSSSMVRSSPTCRASEPSSSGTPGSAPSMNSENRPMSARLAAVMSTFTRSTDVGFSPASTHAATYSSAGTHCMAAAGPSCRTTIPFSRSAWTARTTQRRQKPLVPSTYAPLKNVELNPSAPPGFIALRISPSRSRLSCTR